MPDALRDHVDEDEEPEEEHQEEVEEQEAEHASAWAQVGAVFQHPLYPVTALLTGSVTLARRLATPGQWLLARAKVTATWLRAGEDGDEKLWRCGVVAGCCWSVYLAVRHIWPELLAAGGVLWIAASWAVSPTPHPDEKPVAETPAAPEDEVGELAAKQTGEQEAREAAERLTRSLYRAIDVHTSGGTRGVHLETLAAQLKLSVPALRDHCRRAGIPVRDQLKVRGRNKTGIHRGDVEDQLGAPLHPAADLTPPHDHGVVYPVDHSPGRSA